MPVPTSSTPISDAARPAVEAAHRRYRAMHITERPPPDDPTGLPLTCTERIILARCGYYPVPPDVLLLGCTPEEHRQRHLAAYVREQLDIERAALAAQLPDAIAATRETYQT